MQGSHYPDLTYSKLHVAAFFLAGAGGVEGEGGKHLG